MTLSRQAQDYVRYRKEALELARRALAEIEAMPSGEADVERLFMAHVENMAEIVVRLKEIVVSVSNFVTWLASGKGS